ncbi:hypothetical protein CS542_00430 [Pedobacter sp. IW39]|nr:hypothetical protein CS542_00430 [Pedobacter sp. IW39]
MSMLRADLLDRLIWYCVIRKNNNSFGGYRSCLLEIFTSYLRLSNPMSGSFRRVYKSVYFFDAHALYHNLRYILNWRKSTDKQILCSLICSTSVKLTENITLLEK